MLHVRDSLQIDGGQDFEHDRPVKIVLEYRGEVVSCVFPSLRIYHSPKAGTNDILDLVVVVFDERIQVTSGHQL